MIKRPGRENEIRTREQEATPAPWIDYQQDFDMHVGGSPDGPHIALFGRVSWPGTAADAAFTAHARTDIPYLREQLKKARERIAELEAELSWTCPVCVLTVKGTDRCPTCGTYKPDAEDMEVADERHSDDS